MACPPRHARRALAARAGPRVRIGPGYRWPSRFSRADTGAVEEVSLVSGSTHDDDRFGLAGYGGSGRRIHAPHRRGVTRGRCPSRRPTRSATPRPSRTIPAERSSASMRCSRPSTVSSLVVLATPERRPRGPRADGDQAGIAVVVDKPLAVDTDAALEVVDAASSAGSADGLPEPPFRREHVTLAELCGSQTLARCTGPSCAGSGGGPSPGSAGASRPPRSTGAASCWTCTPTSSTRRSSCSAMSQTVYAEVARAPRTPRTTPSWRAGIPRVSSGTWAPPRWPAHRARACASSAAVVPTCSTSSRPSPTSSRTCATRTASPGGSTAARSASRSRGPRPARPTSPRGRRGAGQRQPGGQHAGGPPGRGAHRRGHRRRAHQRRGAPGRGRDHPGGAHRLTRLSDTQADEPVADMPSGPAEAAGPEGPVVLVLVLVLVLVRCGPPAPRCTSSAVAD